MLRRTTPGATSCGYREVEYRQQDAVLTAQRVKFPLPPPMQTAFNGWSADHVRGKLR